ncbi:hypothetical protein KO527_15890 [Pseudoalteromonas sp. C2R02]|uniref:hypothetical protein n=1 Tax=Pseudoalteromonas sp. C2R02 TaxID=2841565 RepID=UPI001C0A290B|nr:hypothetical protein [Pseudoalteromonas sp. C2R02]MBU2970834.1 hypothetical protein [Pseudoalteromonas sp. C2R02]
MNKSNTSKLLLGLLASVTIIFIIWYHGGHSPLTDQEVSYYIEQIEAQHNNSGKHNIKVLKSFLENDDGKAFYTVNLYQYAKIAQYPQKKLDTISGRDAFDIFSAQMIKLLAKQGSHPIFGSDWTHKLTSSWDRIVIVRYRSRRDIAEIFINPEFTQASVHKWAGIAKHDRLLVQGLHIPSFYPFLLIGLILVILTMIRYLKK